MSTALAAPEPLNLIQIALERDASPDHLARLLDLQERVERTRAEEAFGAALAAFQAECKPILKTRVVLNKNGSERYRFAGYDDIYEAIGPLLRAHGISVSFTVPTTAERFDLTLRLRVGGYYEDKPYSAPMPDVAKLAGQLYMTEPQAFGVCLSYHKRYALCAALNVVVTDEDPDAAAAAEDRAAPITAEQMAELRRLLPLAAKSEEGLLHWLGASEMEALTRADYAKAEFQLRTSAAARKGGAR